MLQTIAYELKYCLPIFDFTTTVSCEQHVDKRLMPKACQGCLASLPMAKSPFVATCIVLVLLCCCQWPHGASSQQEELEERWAERLQHRPMRDRSRGNPHSRKRLLPDNQADGQLTEGEQQDPAAGVDNAAQLPGVTAAALNPQTRTDVAGVDVNQAPAPNNTSPIHSPPPAPDQNVSTIAEMLDKALQKEFHEDSKKSASEAGKNFNDTVKHDEVGVYLCIAIGTHRQCRHVH